MICIYCGKTQQQHSAFNYCNNLLTKFTPPVISTDHTTIIAPEKEPAVEDEWPEHFKKFKNKYLWDLKDYSTRELHIANSALNAAYYNSAGELTKLREDKQELVDHLKSIPDNYYGADTEGWDQKTKELILKHGK